MKNEQKDSPAAIADLTKRFKQLADSPIKSVQPTVINKIASPPQQQQQQQPPPQSTPFADPFGLPANANNTFNAFGTTSDALGTVRADDPFFSASAAAVPNQKLDESDPFRSGDFDAAHELMK
ncbi:unnamed protein product, partial [Adineta steineri]